MASERRRISFAVIGSATVELEDTTPAAIEQLERELCAAIANELEHAGAVGVDASVEVHPA